MATISVSPTPTPISAMSVRRGPLTNNPNVANSPLRGASALAGYAKQKRSYATVQREEPYGQPPPLKKQVIDAASQRVNRSPTRSTRSQVLVQRGATRPVVKDRTVRTGTTSRVAQDVDTEKEAWKRHHRAKFPKMVFYFESIPDETRARLTKRVTYLGARQEPFFSMAVTHVVTTRSIPPERTEAGEEQDHQRHDEHEHEEQPQTINPSLLDRNTEARRKLLYEFRNAPSRSQQLDDPTKRTKGSRNNDVLYKAREMGKKIWSLEKFQNMLNVLLEAETTNGSAYGSRSAGSRSQYGTARGSHEPTLLQLLQHERLNGPSDRDPTAVHRELSYFKGPHLYVWDMDERQKPIMVREYPKVANKADGDWPQFRSVGNGRCPFVEEIDVPAKEHRRQREQEKARAAAAAAVKREDAVPVLRPPQIPVPKPVTGKRSLMEMEDGHNRARPVTPTEVFNPAKVAMMKQSDASQQNAFMSRAAAGRLHAGEPVASGVQPSNITSAIRSQMVSSTSGVAGAKAGTSKEVHGLQRKVLQKAAPASQDVSSRRLAEVSMDVASSRSTNMGRCTSRPADVQEEDSQKPAEKKAQSQTLKSKKDLKPGYCENCQDKFRDFDEHILSRKHRKFAENDENWLELDSLLSQLTRPVKCVVSPSDEEEDMW